MAESERRDVPCHKGSSDLSIATDRDIHQSEAVCPVRRDAVAAAEVRIERAALALLHDVRVVRRREEVHAEQDPIVVGEIETDDRVITIG